MAGHISPKSTYYAVFAALMIGTAITVAVAFVNLGSFNFPVAIGIAITKATLVILFFMPWLDKSPVRSIRYRPGWHKWVYGVFVVVFMVLGYLGIQPPSEVKTLVAQIGTVYYFGFFLLMPWWSRLGEFKAVPDRITFAH